MSDTNESVFGTLHWTVAGFGGILVLVLMLVCCLKLKALKTTQVFHQPDARDTDSKNTGVSELILNYKVNTVLHGIYISYLVIVIFHCILVFIL